MRRFVEEVCGGGLWRREEFLEEGELEHLLLYYYCYDILTSKIGASENVLFKLQNSDTSHNP